MRTEPAPVQASAAASRIAVALLTLGLVAAAAAQAPVLFDNGTVVTHPGAGAGGTDLSVLQEERLGMNLYGFGAQLAGSASNRVADDFEVTAPSGWQLEVIEILPYQTGSGLVSSITHVNYRIWDGPPDDPASSVIYGNGVDDALLSSTFSGIYRVIDTSLAETNRPLMTTTVDALGAYLPTGTYWFDFQLAGSEATGPWITPVTILGESTTGNGLQYLSSGASWGWAVDNGTTTQQGIPFVIRGWDAALEIVQEDIPVPDVSRGDTDVPVMAFYAHAVAAPGLTLTSLGVATVQADGVTPVVDSPVARMKLYLDADFDGVADTPGAPYASVEADPDGTGEFDDIIQFDPFTPVGFVLAYDLKDSLSTTAFPVVAASLALLVPGLWLARRGRKAASLLVMGLIVTAVSACGPTQQTNDIQFRALITGGASLVSTGDFTGSVVAVDAAGAVGGTLTVRY